MTTRVTLGVVDPDILDRANHTGSQAISTITGLQAALDAKADSADIEFGTWTPVATVTANIDAVTVSSDGHYFRVGDQVHCWGFIQIDPTVATDTNTTCRITLPIASDFTATNQLRGVLTTGAVQRAGHIGCDTVNNAASIAFSAQLTTNIVFTYMFDYVIV